MSEHGFLKPNPVLFDLEKLKPRQQLGHELGQGAPCTSCGNKCSGFELHFWKKVCQNCRCGKIEHGVLEQEDHGDYFVGKIFDRPLRTLEEEHSFIYGDVVEDIIDVHEKNTPVTLDWAPPGVSSRVVTKFLKSLGEDFVPIQGTDAAVRRIKQLEKQFPLHDVEPEKCHQLSPGEIDRMSNYVDNVKKNVAGQGIVTQLGDDDRNQERPPSPPPPAMPPPMKLLPIVTSKYDQRQSPIKLTNKSPSLSKLTNQKSSIQHLNNEIWSCAGCGQKMEPGEVAIFAERAGQDKCWHPACFSCCECGEILEDLLYYYSYGQLYCGRHFAAKMNIPRCSACDELIFSAEYTAAEDRYWHVKHFCCWICDMPLAGHKYIPVEGMPHCLKCWQSQHGKTCRTCQEIIHPQDQRVSLGGHHWHTRSQCFKCGVCGVSLMGGKLLLRQGEALCSSTCAQELANSNSKFTNGGKNQRVNNYSTIV